MTVRHFLTLNDLQPQEFRYLIQRAMELKKLKGPYEPLKNRTLGMIFEKSSTRTRVSFEVGIVQLGGAAIFLSPQDSQLGRGEPLEDTARVLSGMVDCIVLRTHRHATVTRFAEFSKVPVVNGLTDRFHPCQLLADMLTYIEYRGDIGGRKVAWIGDGNNMCHSYINAARLLDFHLHIASPKGYEPDPEIVSHAKDHVTLGSNPSAAADSADLIVTDVWASMGQEEEQHQRVEAFRHFQINSELMKHAKPDALFMHCLPAHRGEEVSPEVLEGPQSVVWAEAENRLHGQKALLEFLLLGQSS